MREPPDEVELPTDAEGNDDDVLIGSADGARLSFDCDGKVLGTVVAVAMGEGVFVGTLLGA